LYVPHWLREGLALVSSIVLKLQRDDFLFSSRRRRKVQGQCALLKRSSAITIDYGLLSTK
jgi:hypothetical protein